MREAAALLCGALALSLGQLPEVDKQCQGQAKCVGKYNCPAFTKAEDILDSLSRGSDERSRVLSLMTGSVCNKAARGVCCPREPCNLGQTCVPQHQCQEFQQLRQKLTQAVRDSPERSSLLTQLKDVICDQKTKTVCCNPSAGTAATRPTGNCDLSDSSCLPAPGECGLAGDGHRFDSNIAQRVVGGDDAIPGEFPFTALLGTTKNIVTGQSFEVAKIWICGGTLINRRYVVTAGHCQDTRPGKQIAVVRLGEYQVTDNMGRDCVNPWDLSTCLPEPQDFSIQPEDVTVHPQYKSFGSSSIFDIALIRLPRLVDLNSGVSVACLPINPAIAAAQLNVPDIGEGLAGFYATVVGWGYTEADPYDRERVGLRKRVANTVQQKLAVPVLTTEACETNLASIEPGFSLKENMICAGGKIGQGSCKGDSGGPLYLKDRKATDSKKPWYLLGIVSFGTKSCSNAEPAIYTRVESFVTWIQSEIKKPGSCDLSDGSCLPASGECGLSGGRGREQRIVGGKTTIPGEFPYTALIGKIKKETSSVTGQSYEVKIWICGGTLINRRYVVTAGHCQSTRPGRQISVVRLGEYQVTDSGGRDCVDPSDPNTCLPEPQDFSIQPEDVTVHPQYESTRTGAINNIALIRLPRLVDLNPGVSVACLPIDPLIAAAQLNVPDIGEGLAGFYATVVGWGSTEADPFNRELTGEIERVASSFQQKLAIPVLTTEACETNLSSIVPGFTLKENMICAGGERGKDSCQGDSGGPLYLKGRKVSSVQSADSQELWYLLGIESFGTKTCGSGKPAIYTRVESYIPWIRSVSKK